MQTFVGRTALASGADALDELTTGWPSESPDLLVVFSSTRQDARDLRERLERRYPGATLIGCTTSGEHCRGARDSGTASACALYTPHVRWHAEPIAPLSRFEPRMAAQAVERAQAALGVDADNVDPRELVAVLLCDGLSRKEEWVAAAVADALAGVPLVGGSAGDDLAFKQTLVSMRGQTCSDAAVMLLAKGPVGFYRVLKHQHFSARSASMVVTRADPPARRVFELDGYPAADVYAGALGVERAQLAEASSLNPVLITVAGQPYVRSVQQVHEDGSLTFYCAVEEGWILDVAGHQAMEDALRRDLQAIRGAEPAGFLLEFNCILRALEADKRGLHAALGAAIAEAADATIGFDTYGEVLDGLHINQTLVALLLSRAA